MITLRTKLLLCGATMAPLSVLLARMSAYDSTMKAEAEGAISVWVEPGFIHYFLFCAGLVCSIGFVVSVFLDLRHGKKNS
jgi:hypothetical protein